ncbi:MULTISPECIES: winged helix-turn-helix transcriptional regulator [Variovorax]|uniref:winged helix-turn-helix transcriptional regulator n=1 Tax=Variovorax TaxID=34072 RepID=UPI00285A9DB5|nr:winged helix-turn-helix domain-containing protein [Variovorax sp. 3319]MDR6889729.1 DNA-binding response OmpR family regulator [Variovorax sp. 3319]
MKHDDDQGCRIAIVDSAAKTRERLRRAARRLGYLPVTFESTAELLHECGSSGAMFRAVLLVCPKGPQLAKSVIAQLRNWFGTHMPMVLCTTKRQVPFVAGLDGASSDAVAITPTTFQGAYSLLESFSFQHGFFVPDPVLECGAYRLFLASGKVEVAGNEVKLAPIELDLAVELFRNIDRQLNREWLRAMVWEKGFTEQSRSLDTSMSGVRHKLGLHTGEHGLRLHSIRGTGYQLSGAAWAL